MVQTRTTTLEEFERFIARPENEDRRFEYIEGEIVEVVTDYFCSLVAARILSRMNTYAEEHELGYVTGEAGGYQVGENRYIPDVGFISKQRQPEAPHGAFNPNPPDLVVEVISPTDRPKKVRTKTANYVASGIIVWLVDPEAQEIEIHTPGMPVKTYQHSETLDAGTVIPGFKIILKDIFKP
jgi:Uma2 family endonuclease